MQYIYKQGFTYRRIGPLIPVRRIVHQAIMKRFSNEIDITIQWNLVILVVLEIPVLKFLLRCKQEF